MGGGAACTVAQKEERVRVSGLFREFLDIGSSKLDASMAPRLIKEALKSGGADNATAQRMVSEFKEVAPTRWPAGVIDAGGFASWYMDIAWPALHAAAEQRAKQPPKPPRPEAKPLRVEVGPSSAADGGAAVGARGAAPAHNMLLPTKVASGPDPAPARLRWRRWAHRPRRWRCASRSQRRRDEWGRVDAGIQELAARLVEATLRSTSHVQQFMVVAQIARHEARRMRVAQHARCVADFRWIF